MRLLIEDSDRTADAIAAEIGVTKRTIERTFVSLQKKGKVLTASILRVPEQSSIRYKILEENVSTNLDNIKYNKAHEEKMPKITPHVYRHTFCTLMAKTGIKPNSLQYIMGHADIKATLGYYTHFKADRCRERNGKDRGQQG